MARKRKARSKLDRAKKNRDRKRDYQRIYIDPKSLRLLDDPFIKEKMFKRAEIKRMRLKRDITKIGLINEKRKARGLNELKLNIYYSKMLQRVNKVARNEIIRQNVCRDRQDRRAVLFALRLAGVKGTGYGSKLMSWKSKIKC